MWDLVARTLRRPLGWAQRGGDAQSRLATFADELANISRDIEGAEKRRARAPGPPPRPLRRFELFASLVVAPGSHGPPALAAPARGRAPRARGRGFRVVSRAKPAGWPGSSRRRRGTRSS